MGSFLWVEKQEVYLFIVVDNGRQLELALQSIVNWNTFLIFSYQLRWITDFVKNVQLDCLEKIEKYQNYLLG